MTPESKPVLGMILKGYPRISETFISNEIHLLEQQGIKIHIFSMRKPREHFSHASVKQIKAAVDYLPESILPHLPRLLYHNIRLAVHHPKRYAAAAATAWRRFVRTRKSATLKHLLQAGYLVHGLLPKTRVVHLHAHFAHSPASVAMFAGRLSGLPFSFTAHAKDIYTSDARQLEEKIKLAAFAVTCTNYNRDYLRRLSGDGRTSLYCVYHGIDLRLFDGGGRSTHRTVAPFQLLTVARLIEKKGLPDVLQAVKHLKSRSVAIQFTLIGDGEDKEKLHRMIRELGIDDITRCTGTLPHEAVLSHYRSADLFVLGCRVAANGDRDGIPNVLVESMAMGVPVVATQVSAIPELVTHGETGFLVPPDRPDALARAMEELLLSPDLRHRIAVAARARVENGFDNRMLIRELARIYARHVPGLTV